MKKDRLITKDYKGKVKGCVTCNYTRPIEYFRGNRSKCNICNGIDRFHFNHKDYYNKFPGSQFRTYLYNDTDYLDMFDSWDRQSKDDKPTIKFKDNDTIELSNIIVTTVNKEREKRKAMTVRHCTKCGILKPMSEFNKAAKEINGHRSICKDCERGNRLTEYGVILEIYNGQRKSSRNRGHSYPSYTKEELTKWLYKHGFKELYNSYVKSGEDKWLRPSVDRLDDDKPYSFDNIRLGTWKDNADHKHESDSKPIRVLNVKTNKEVVYNTVRETLENTFVSFTAMNKRLDTNEEFKGYKFYTVKK